MHRPLLFAVALLPAITSLYLQAAVPPERRALPGGDLTAWGAQKEGNTGGAIPAYEAPEKIDAAAFLQEKPLFSIDADNRNAYADKLSSGTLAMLERYPGYRLDVYPTRRTVIYPNYVIANSIRNVESCHTIQEGLQLEGCYAGLPFPTPRNGNEVMWNHTLRYQALAWQSTLKNHFVHGSGLRMLQSEIRVFQQSPFYDPKRKEPAAVNEPYYMVRSDYVGPPRRVGEKLTLHDSLDMLENGGRQAWQYLPGMRRVKLTPGLAYDTPNPHTAGTSGMDETQLFLGSLDRYDFKLLGKKELYIPYNNFLFNDSVHCPTDKRLQRHYLHPDCIRWELHRVWVVEGTLKKGKRHLLPKRELYFDEDAPGAGVADSYDGSGTIAHVGASLSMPLPGTQSMITDAYVTYELLTGSYSLMGDSAETGGVVITEPLPNRFFSPDALAAEGIR